MSKFTIILHLGLMKRICCQWKFIHEFLFICGVLPERCIKFSNFFSWEPLVHQIHDVISLINTESKRRLKIQKFIYLIAYPSLTLIYNYSSNTFLSSGKYVSLLVVFRTSSVETIIYYNVPSDNTLM